MTGINMWHIGQRVVCVDGTQHKEAVDGVSLPVKGNIYTIRDVEGYKDGIGLRLYELINPQFFTEIGMIEPSYNSIRFKPLDEKRIDIFRAMLKNKEKEKVE